MLAKNKFRIVLLIVFVAVIVVAAFTDDEGIDKALESFTKIITSVMVL